MKQRMKRHIRNVLGLVVLISVFGTHLSNHKAATISYLPITAQAATGTGWIEDNTGWWYRNADGTYPKDQWLEINGKWYLFDKRGYMLTDWQEVNGKWYYMNSRGAMQTGWVTVNGDKYYLNNYGVMQTGWVTVNGHRYYMNNDGVMQTGYVTNQRPMGYSSNRAIIDGDFYWKSSRAREWLHSTSQNPQFTNKGIVTRRTRGFLSEFSASELNQIAITRRRTPTNHKENNGALGLTPSERRGDEVLLGDDGLGAMWPYSMRYQGRTYGDPMSTDSASNGGFARWESTITYDKVFIPTAWELQRYVESRGWSMARSNTHERTGIQEGYWVGGTQTYTGNTYRGIFVMETGRVYHENMRNRARGIVPMLHLKPNAPAGRNRKIGDIIDFGRYDSNNAEGHRGAIRWRIVNETPDGHKLIMAEQAVDHFGYNVAPSGDPNNTTYTKSNYVNFNTYDVDIVDNLLFQNTNESGRPTTRGNPLQPWFNVVNKGEFHRRNTIGARFRIQGRAPSGSSPDTLWAGGNFVRGSATIEYRATENDPGGYVTPITIKSSDNLYMTGHLPFNMIDEPVTLDVKYDLPYNGYAANNQYVDIEAGLSNWDVNHVIPRWKQQLQFDGSHPIFMLPQHTTYAGTRYRMSGRMRVTDWGGLRSVLSASEWNSSGFKHRSYGQTLTQPRWLHDMYLTSNSYNPMSKGSGTHGYDGSVGPVSDPIFMTWAQLRDAPGAGWVNFNTVMPIPNTMLNINGIGFHAYPNMSTRQVEWPEIEIENLTFELIDDQLFRLDWIRLPNGNTLNNPPVGSMTKYRATTTGAHTFVARDSRGYNWNATANIKIDKTAPTGNITANTTNPTNGNVALTLDSQDVETGLSKVEYISGGKVVSQSIPAINQNSFLPSHRSTFVVSENGTYRFRLTDRAGNVREVTHTVGNIDRTAPTTSVSQSPTAWTNKNVTVSWKANAQGLADLRRVRFHDGSGWSAWTNASGRTQTFNRTITGNTTVHFQVEDMAGNVASRSHTVSNIDKDLPEMTFSHNPSTWTNANVTTTIRARDHGANGRISGLNRMRFRSHSGTWSSWISYPSNTELSYGWFNQTSTITTNGGYDVQIEDRAGNLRSQTFTVDWIDRTPPNVTSSQSPTAWTNGNVNITWTASATGSPLSRIRTHNGSTWGAWSAVSGTTSSTVQTVTSNGTYHFQVQDTAGNVRQISHTVGNIDKELPNGTISGNPTSWTNQNVTLTFNATDTGGSGVRRVRQSGGTWVNGTTTTQTATANGTYSFEVEDHAGNTRTVSATVTRIDKELPNGTISGNPTSWTNQNVTLTFNATDTGGSGVRRVRQSGGTWVDGSTTSRTVSSNGTYSFEVEDNAGNTRTVSVTVNRIDKTLPNANSTQSPTAWTNGNVNITWTASATGSPLSRIRTHNGSTWGAWSAVSGTTSSTVQTVTSNGTYHFQVQDTAGNVRQISHTVGNIDKGTPHIRSSQSPTAWTNGNVTLTFEARDYGELNNQSTHISGISAIQVKRPNGTVWNDTYGSASEKSGSYYTRTFTATENGAYVVTVTDRAGNQASHTHNVTNIDRVLPTGSTKHMSDWTKDNVWIDVTGHDTASGLASIKYVSGGSITGSAEATYTGTTSNQTARFIATQNGTYMFDIRDRAGNVSRVTQTVSNIDRTAPTASSRLRPNTWTNQNVGIILSGQDLNNQGTRISGVNRIRMRLAGSSTWLDTQTVTDSTESSPTFAERTFTVTDNGTYEFELQDRAGNTSIVRQTVDKIDRTPPKASGSFTPDGWTNQDITITWIGERTGKPGAPLRRYRTHNGSSWSAWQNASSPDRISVKQIVKDNGTYRFEVQDDAGNIATSHVVVSKYDDVAPVGNIRARFNRTESEVVDGSSVDVEMIDQNRVTVDVFGVEDLGISGVEFIEIEEQRRTGSITSAAGSTINNWQTVDTYRYDWPDPYTVKDQTYQINASQALDTRFILTVQDRAGNRSTQAVSNNVRHSVLQFKDFKVVDVVNPQLTQAERDQLRNVDLATNPATVTAGTDVTFELTYLLRHLDAVKQVAGNIVITMADESGREIHTINIQVDEPKTGHNQDLVVRRTFTVPEGVPKGTTLLVTGNLLAELEHGTRHEIWYPNDDSMGSVDNHLEEFFRFRIVQ